MLMQESLYIKNSEQYNKYLCIQCLCTKSFNEYYFCIPRRGKLKRLGRCKECFNIYETKHIIKHIILVDGVNGNQRCGKCKVFKEPNNFYINKKRTLGITTICIDCTRIENNISRYSNNNKEKKLKQRLQDIFNNNGEKKCNSCLIFRCLNQYYKKGSNYCKQCINEKRLKREYNLNINVYNNLLKSQNNQCGICKRDLNEIDRKKIHIDHNHKTGQVRGILCFDCNLGLGFLKDDKINLTNAINYLVKI